MRRPETDPENVQMTDVLCDFCHRTWTEDIAMVEGHQGSCICGKCLDVAWDSVVEGGLDDSIDDWKCTMCLERREDPCHRSPAHDDAFICRRCIRVSAQALRKDDVDWNAPGPRRDH